MMWQVLPVGGQLSGFVLHADPAFGEPGQVTYIARFCKNDAVLAVDAGRGRYTGFAKQREISVAGVMTAIDPQDHRRVRVVGRADGFPLLGPERLQGFLQPARVGGAHHRVMFQLGQQRFAFALGAAQHGVEQGLGPRLFQLVGATDGFADCRVGRHAGVEQLIQAHQQQRLDIGVRRLERLLQQLGRQRR
jgi:hypothetical protein